MTQKAIHGFVQGRVQGVFFRVSMRKQAIKHGVTGWVKNTVDSRVEFLLSGPEAAIAAMVDWLWSGSFLASVDDVSWTEVTDPACTEFNIIRE